MSNKLNKFVIKCGNFAVLVNLHALPLGGREDTSWFSQELKEEVSALIREAVDQRVKQFLESRQQQHRGPQVKLSREMTPANPLCVKGPTFRLAAYFMKRHVNLRCIAKQRNRELRIFPEQFVVCVSRLEDTAMALRGNVTRSMEEQGGQSRSEYFSGRGETLDPLNSSAITKRTALQKIAKQVNAQAESRPPNSLNNNYGKPEAPGPSGSSAAERGDAVPPLCPRAVGGHAVDGAIQGGVVASSTGARLEGEEGEALAPLSKPSKPRNERSGTASQRRAANPQQQESNNSSSTTTTTTTTTTTLPQAVPCVGPNSNNSNSSGRSKKRLVRLQEDLLTQDAKRICLRGPSEPTTDVLQSDSSKRASPRSFTLGPSQCMPPLPLYPPPPPPLLEDEETSCTLEAEFAAHGKQSGRLPLRISNAEQTNRSRLATSLRGLSVKPVSSGSSIGSRPAAKEEKEKKKKKEEEKEGKLSAARTSRLRRPKKS